MNLTNDSKKLVGFYEKKENIKRAIVRPEDFKHIFNLVKSSYNSIETRGKIPNARIKTNRKKNQISKTKKLRKVRLYLNNIDTCSFNESKKRLKNGDNLLAIFRLLGNENKDTLHKIYLEHNYPSQKQSIINRFLDDLSLDTKMSFDKCIEWVNLHGIELLRSIYISHLQGKLPKKINNYLGEYPHTKGEFTSLDIQNEIQLGLKKNRKFNIEINGTRLNLLLFSENDFKMNHKFLKRCFILDAIRNKKRKDINLEIWLSNKKKNLPPKREKKYLGSKEVNSGCNTFNGMENRVSVWRKEELPKVLVHELVHSLGLEKYNGYKEVEDFIYNHFDIKRNNRFNLFENYVELVANILNICLTMIENGKGDIKSFNRMIDLECTHCLFQVGKILNYYGYKNFEDFYKKKGLKEENKTDRYLQKSNIFSYFVMRSMVIFNINDFIKLCRDKNKRNFFKQDFECVEFLPIVLKTLKDPLFESTINNNIVSNKQGNKGKVVFNNLRMTCIEVKI
jgi:hypothetical protein